MRQVSAVVHVPLYALCTLGWIAEPAAYGSFPPLTKPQKRTRLTPLEARTCKPVLCSGLGLTRVLTNEPETRQAAAGRLQALSKSL